MGWHVRGVFPSATPGGDFAVIGSHLLRNMSDESRMIYCESHERCGQTCRVSIMTVSRVVNQSAPVDDATRAKVEDLIQKLRFKPNLPGRRQRHAELESRRRDHCM